MSSSYFQLYLEIALFSLLKSLTYSFMYQYVKDRLGTLYILADCSRVWRITDSNR